MPKFDLSLCLVTYRNGLAMNRFLEIIEQAVEGGVTLVQLREKETSTQKTLEIGQKLQSILLPRKVPLIINDNVRLAYRLRAGVHLGQSDGSVIEAREVLGDKAIIGFSVDTEEQAIAAQELPVDYISPTIFPSQTKPDALAWGVERVTALSQWSRHPLLPIGGINSDNAHAVRKCGAKGIAVISAIFNAECPKTAASELKRVFYG